jgi:acyl carrier protein
VLQLDPAEVDDDAPLAGLGFDSLMSLDLRKRLEGTLGVALPATLAWRYPTVHAIVPFLAERMGIALVPPPHEAPPPAREAPAQPPGGADPGRAASATATDLAGADDFDIEAMLLAKLEDIDALDDLREGGRDDRSVR